MLLLCVLIAFLCGWFFGCSSTFGSSIPHLAVVRHWLGVQHYRKEAQDLWAVWSALALDGNAAPGTVAGMGFLAIVQAYRNLSRNHLVQ